MNRRSLALLPLLAGCAQPLHLQYDFGRATLAAAAAQADLNRTTAAEAAYLLTGAEALEIRANVEKAAVQEKSGKAEATADQ